MSAPIQLNSTMQKLPAEEESTIPAVSTVCIILFPRMPESSAVVLHTDKAS